MSVCVSVLCVHGYRCLKRPEGAGFSGVGTTGHWELSLVDAETELGSSARAMCS